MIPWSRAGVRALVLAAMVLALAGGCGINPPLRLSELDELAKPVELTDVPFHPQEAHHCGPASLLTVLEASGVSTDYQAVVDRVYVPGLEGSLQVELLAAARGFERIAYVLPPEPEAVFREAASGRPVLVLLNLGVQSKPIWHYAVVVGFDPLRNRVLLRSGGTEREATRAPVWLRRWDWGGRWAMTILEPGEWPAAPRRENLLRALAAFEDAADPALAERAWRTVSERWPEEPIAWLGLGNSAHRQERWQTAEEAYRRALAIDPERLPARLNLALALGEQGRACEGLEALGSPPGETHRLQRQYLDLEVRLRGACTFDRS